LAFIMTYFYVALFCLEIWSCVLKA
jgi:hypothetical protein